MNILSIIIRSFSSVGKLSVLYVKSNFIKKSAIKKFKNELNKMGIAEADVLILTQNYSDMVNLNPLLYLKKNK
ncbi:hypothetical protein [Bacillus sp. EAC]|uniref:hypothetical protein n=1 Tax=Bacillus sp. EAC TaxID=1978338 RepID=UPI000B43F379|nr:hypothetical protein [Bacillus sp. EAC]